jgi:D-glycero-D-manno-heptose 1,7-bisphosphate phosphatase
LTLANKLEDRVTQPGVFLDRDGTVTVEIGYVNHPSRLQLIDGAGAAIRWLNEAGIPVVLVTNQAGVARGYFPRHVVDLVHARLADLLAAEGAHLDGVYYSPFVKGGKVPPFNIDHPWRKPNTGMIDAAAGDLGIDLAASYMVGDKITDAELGQRMGGKGVFVLTGYGRGELEYYRDTWPIEPDHTAEDLGGAIGWILGDMGR